MFGRIAQLTLAVLGLSILNGVGWAQAPVRGVPRPASGTPGFASNELRQIYNTSVGYGYSVESLNQIALQNARDHVPNFGQSTATRSSFGTSPAPIASKPFASITPAPTVSPYMNLFREDLSGASDLNYQTLVRPQLQQQQFNQQIQRQSMEIARRLQSVAAQPNFEPQGSRTQPPTGHPTAYMYYGRFYPQLMQQQRRR